MAPRLHHRVSTAQAQDLVCCRKAICAPHMPNTQAHMCPQKPHVSLWVRPCFSNKNATETELSSWHEQSQSPWGTCVSGARSMSHGHPARRAGRGPRGRATLAAPSLPPQLWGPLPWWGSRGWGAGGCAAGSQAVWVSLARVGRIVARGLAVGGWTGGGQMPPPGGPWGAWAT